ncbi:MAG: recombinase family protein [Oscillospiraceae bacterium]|jgi:DNA invertase Pin-like site-specific DNA recombinase|nr:recombinase family protein [Oscillospiraceae bacterium]
MSEIFGYGRVSTKQQNLDRQYDLFKKNRIPERNILMEKISGTIRDRPELDELKKRVRSGDIVYIESYSRLGRSVKNLIAEIEWFTENGVRLVSDKENFDTDSSSGQLMLNIMLAFAQFERDLIVERTQEGKRVRGIKGGRKPKSKEEIEYAQALYDSKRYSIPTVLKMANMSEKTFRKYIINDKQQEEMRQKENVQKQPM